MISWPSTGPFPQSFEVATVNDIIAAYRRIRAATVALAAPLHIEDYVIQSCPEASPPKWHLAHTTWFFETLVLEPIPDLRHVVQFVLRNGGALFPPNPAGDSVAAGGRRGARISRTNRPHPPGVDRDGSLPRVDRGRPFDWLGVAA